MKLLEKLDTYKDSDVIAYVHNEEKLTYRELNQKANRLAYYLQAVLKEDKTPIPVYGHKGAMMLICFLACVKSGRAYCPIDTGIPMARVEDILDSIASSLVLSDENLSYAKSSVMDHEQINQIIETQEKEIMSEAYVQADDTFYIIFTSGSSGTPKGVQISYDNLNHFLEWSIPLAQAQDNQKVFINQAPFSFDLSVMDVYSALGSGGTIFALDKEIIKDYSNLFSSLHASNANVWVSTPSFADMCLIDKSFHQELLPQLDTFLFCGEILSKETVEKLQARFKNAKIYNTYGPSETTVAVSALLIDEAILETCNPLPIGKAKPHTCFEIIDTEGNVLKDMEKGEIIILGDTVGKGYYKNNSGTKKAFFTKLHNGERMAAYHSGDAGYLKEGMLYYCGRMDLQVKVNGYRIEITDIEQNLYKVAHVESVVVLPNYKGDKIKNLIAYVKYDGDTSNRFALGQSISLQLKQYIPEYMIPKKYIFLKEMPMSNNGKADRMALQKAYV